jgi:molybdate transport system substrate-binding protein
MSVLTKLGIAELIKAKGVVPPLGSRVGTLVAKGEAEIGVQQITELLQIPGIDFVGPLPQELQANIVYAAAIPTSVKEREAALEFIKFLRSEPALPVIKKVGLEPVAQMPARGPGTGGLY